MYLLLKALSWLVCRLPLNFSLKVGRALALLVWFFLPSKRKSIATENIRSCLKLDDTQAARIARESTVQLGSSFIEVLALPSLDLRHFVKISGLDFLTDYKNSSERGAVIVTCHSDNWELMGATFAAYGIPLVGVAKKQSSLGADKFINEIRTQSGMLISYRSDVRSLFRLLDDGHFIGLISDQDTGRNNGVVVKFFNRPTNFVTGAAALARFRNVPIFPAFMHRNPDGSHSLCISKPIFISPSPDKRADILHATQIIAALFENHITSFPNQWFWLHDRWKSIRLEFSPQEVADLELAFLSNPDSLNRAGARR